MSRSRLMSSPYYQLGYENLLDSSISEPIYMGMVTDTGSFRYPSVSKRTHELVSCLLNSGLDHTKVYSQIFDNNSIERLKLRSFAICNKLEILY